MDWVRSAGGPLICVETNKKGLWGGTSRLTTASPYAKTDYDRACRLPNYTSVVPLATGCALVLAGAGPADTSVWRAVSGITLIVQVLCSEADVNEKAYLASLNETLFLDAIACVEFPVESEELVLFDSSEPGDDIRDKSISFRISPGTYRILTQKFDPSPDTCFLLHKFDKVLR